MKRQKYTEEFKQGAIDLVIEQGLSCAEVGRRLGTGEANVSRWVREARRDNDEITEHGASFKEIQARIRQLEEENKRLEMEREILKRPPHSLPRNRHKSRVYPAVQQGIASLCDVSGTVS